MTQLSSTFPRISGTPLVYVVTHSEHKHESILTSKRNVSFTFGTTYFLNTFSSLILYKLSTLSDYGIGLNKTCKRVTFHVDTCIWKGKDRFKLLPPSVPVLIMVYSTRLFLHAVSTSFSVKWLRKMNRNGVKYPCTLCTNVMDNCHCAVDKHGRRETL